METILGVEVLLCVLTLILYVLCAQWIEHTGFEYLHESALAILLGGISGGFVYWIGEQDPIEFDHRIFFYCMLPPIIFAAGYTLKTNQFFLNIGYVWLFGFVGTFISFVLLSTFAVFFNFNGALASDAVLSAKECLLLACVLSATDTVAAVSIVKETKYPKLNSILFGEGVINDAVSIVIFRAVEEILQENEQGEVAFGVVEAWKILISFLFITTTSIILGATFGLLCSFMLKKTPGINEFPTRETTLIIMLAYISYIIAEVLDISGIVTIFMCGLTMAHYTVYNISEESRQGTNLAFNTLAQGAEAFTFTYLGLTMMSLSSEHWSFIYMVSMLFATIVARAGSVFLSSLLVYGVQWGKFGLDSRNIWVIWYSGLIRGAVSFAMVMQITGNNRLILISTTMGIVLLTTLALSALLPSFTRFVGLDTQTSDPRANYLEMMKIPNESYYVRQVEAAGLSKFHAWWTQVDERFLKPIFGGEHETPIKSQRAAWEKIWSEEEESIIKTAHRKSTKDPNDIEDIPKAADTEGEDACESEEEEKKSQSEKKSENE